VLDGAPVLGISVFGALDDVGSASLNWVIDAGRLSTYRVVHLTSVGRRDVAGFSVLPKVTHLQVRFSEDATRRLLTGLFLLIGLVSCSRSQSS
jgi:hypothetical protein